MGLRIFESVAEFAISGRVPDFQLAGFKSPDHILKEQQEIKELEALYKQKSVPTGTTKPASSTDRTNQKKKEH